MENDWISSWESLGARAPESLMDARLEAHWASQTLAAAGYSQIPPRPDDSHTALDYRPGDGSLVTEAFAENRRIALRLSDLTLFVLDADRTSAEYVLAGRTLDQAFAWLHETLGCGRLERPTYDMPPHPIAEGKPFSAVDRDSLAELVRWYS